MAGGKRLIFHGMAQKELYLLTNQLLRRKIKLYNSLIGIVLYRRRITKYPKRECQNYKESTRNESWG